MRWLFKSRCQGGSLRRHLCEVLERVGLCGGHCDYMVGCWNEYLHLKEEVARLKEGRSYAHDDSRKGC